MTPQAVNFLAEALCLSESDRSDLAARLIESLEPEAAHSVEEGWEREIRHRLEELQTGDVQPIPWTEARRLILEDTDEPIEP